MSTPVEQVGPPVIVTAHGRRGPYTIEQTDGYATGLSYADVVDALLDDHPGDEIADLIDIAIAGAR